ncbi:MAG: hypothetical protein ABWY00_14805 [Dongiaceae bacterium]
MVETAVTSRALTYRDPSISAAAEAQLRRNRQRSLGVLEEQAQQSAAVANDTAEREQGKAYGYRAAKDAAQNNDRPAENTADRQVEAQLNQAQLNQARGNRQSMGQKTADDVSNVIASDVADSYSSVPFTTQMIAQEYIGDGLYVPPLQPADEAYRRAGAEPPLIAESATSGLLSLAI